MLKQFVDKHILFEVYRLIAERMFARPIDLVSYAGGSVNSW
jgi:hypothetical protein